MTLCVFSIKKAVALINGLDTAKFPLLLSRILQKLHIKVCLSVLFYFLMTFTHTHTHYLAHLLSMNIIMCTFFVKRVVYLTFVATSGDLENITGGKCALVIA